MTPEFYELLGLLYRKVPGSRERILDLLDDTPWARAHNENRIGEKQCFLKVVRNENDGPRFLVPYLQELLLHDLTCLRVERGERLVHQKDLGMRGKRTRQIGPLFHAARQLVRIGVLRIGGAASGESV